ncbi:Histone-lysine N-methyltransferase setd3 [Chlorella vulgaris]
MQLFDVNDERKRALLQQLGVLHSLSLRVQQLQIEDLLTSARVHCISKIELYFLQDASQLRQPLNLRNEAAAVSLLLGFFAEHHSDEGGIDAQAQQALLAELLRHGRTLWPELASGNVTASGSSSSSSAATVRGEPVPADSPAGEFEAWAVQQGVAAGIQIASFDGLRGCAASRNVAPGDLLLSVPSDVLIYQDSVMATDLGRMLHAIPNLTVDNLLIIFTMIDRHDADSRWALYWRSLPHRYYTGLSFPQAVVDALRGTAAHLELTRAQAHLRQQYAASKPLFDMLLTAYPQFLEAGWFDYDSYLWAAELWYSYAFEIEFPDSSAAADKGGFPAAVADVVPVVSGSKPGASTMSSSTSGGSATTGSCCKPVMVPFACHVNHSPWPHCVRYGRLNPTTRTLDFPAFRPCTKGQQASPEWWLCVFISYGPVPNLKLLCYYGFCVPSNPHDLVPLQLEPPEGPLQEQQAAVLEAKGLGLEHSLQDGPLSRQLLGCLRVVVATAEELESMRKGTLDPVAGPIAAENEEQALHTLQTALLGLLEPLEQLPLLVAGDGDVAEALAAVNGDNAAEAVSGLLRLHPYQPAADGDANASIAEQTAAPPPADQQPQCNENGFDADWRTSLRFCQIYLRGQQYILQQSLKECRRLMHP